VLVKVANGYKGPGAQRWLTLLTQGENKPLQTGRRAAGEEIVIAKTGKPKASLVPYRPRKKKRRFGQNLLGITYIADDFDGPLPPELQKHFE
jgi:antitoxin (DNA-binding transcriptional repressor) of toxin-antitoxin stability system